MYFMKVLICKKERPVNYQIIIENFSVYLKKENIFYLDKCSIDFKRVNDKIIAVAPVFSCGLHSDVLEFLRCFVINFECVNKA